MKPTLLRIVAVSFFMFSITAISNDILSPMQTIMALKKELKEKDADKVIKLIYNADEKNNPKLTAETKDQIIKQLTMVLSCLVNGKISSEKETKYFAAVTMYEILPGNKKSANLKTVYLLKVNGHWKVSPLLFDLIRIAKTSQKEFREQSKILKKWAEKQAEMHSSKLCKTLKITKKQIPYKTNIILAVGNAVTIEFPDGKTLAIWCNPNTFPLPGDTSNLDLSYGEKPFKSLEIKMIPNPNGGMTCGGYISYIRSGSVITWSSGPGHEYILYIGDFYRVSLREEGDKDGKLPVKLSVRVAKQEEKVKPENEVDYYVAKLKSKVPAQKINAMKKLQENLVLGCIYATPRWSYIVKSIKPLKNDPDQRVRKHATETLAVLGDLDCIMDKISPEPKGKNLSDEVAWELGHYTRRAKNKKGKKIVYEHVKSFFESKNPKLRAFAVTFFACADKLPEIRQNLIDAQRDKSPEVRKASIIAMCQIYPSKEIPKHRIPMLEDKSDEVIIEILYASVGHGEDQELPVSVIKKFVYNSNKKIRLAAIAAIEYKDNRHSEAILLPLTYDEDKDIRSEATCALSGDKSPKVYKRFLELLYDNDSLVKIRALQGLDLDNYIDAIPHLERFIKQEKNKDVLETAQETLGKLRRLKRKQK